MAAPLKKKTFFAASLRHSCRAPLNKFCHFAARFELNQRHYSIVYFRQLFPIVFIKLDKFENMFTEILINLQKYFHYGTCESIFSESET